MNPLTQIIPSYLYQQYSDEDSLIAFVNSYNQMTQSYLDWFNAISLPDYTGPPIVSNLLDWVGQGIYGMKRPILTSGSVLGTGPLNTWELNVQTLNAYTTTFSGTTYATSDDAYKRVLTWWHYKGDGFIFSIQWLKNRVYRFLYGLNGVDVNCGDTKTIGVALTSVNTVTITIPKSSIATVFQAAVQTGVVNLPNQFIFTVTIV